MISKPAGSKKSAAHKKEIEKQDFPVVGIGCSTGGLESITQLLKYLPSDTGMAYIYVQHLSPDHKSFLPSLLSKITKMKVQEINDMDSIVPDTIYVIPNNKAIEVVDGHIKLVPRKRGGAAVSVDVLFSSLAEARKENVIGIVLSGNGHDGTMGIKAIKEAGGLTFAQDSTAQANSMPASAIGTGMVDYVLSPKSIALKLKSLYKNGFLKRRKAKVEIVHENKELKTIFELLYKQTNVDFSYYKTATITRRLNNRMLQAGVQTIKQYEKVLHSKTEEVNLLYKDLLINVSSFFRDAETFNYLKETFLPKLLKSKSIGETMRIWVTACSRGEEAYSIAILISELQENRPVKIPVQIFATDLSEDVIRKARMGRYTESDMVSVTPARIKRFFTRDGAEYIISKEVREMCIFAPHNILRDPPFFRIDFISCRNLLIYFNPAAQERALSIMHFALKEAGYLLLGKAESIGTSSQIFTQKDNSFKIYTRKNNLSIHKVPKPTPRLQAAAGGDKAAKPDTAKAAVKNSNELDSTINNLLLERYMPACAVINREMEILQFRGPVSLYLSHPSGKATLNILKMIRPECAYELRDAILQAVKTNLPAYKSGIEIEYETGMQCVSIEVSPVHIHADEFLLLIVFTQPPNNNAEGAAGVKAPAKTNAAQKDLKIKKLTAELNRARAQVLSVIEAQEKAYEELQVANEEIVSANEEFQTLNEELETSKEEIEATNEELISVNQDLKIHNKLLEESYDYAQMIIATMHEPMVILDSNLHVQSANKSFYKKFMVTAEECEGISLFEIGNDQWNIPQLRILLMDMVSKNLAFNNFEVTHVFPKLGEKVMRLNAGRILQKTYREKLIMLAIEDITELTKFYAKEKALMKETITLHEQAKIELEKEVTLRTKELKAKNLLLENANKDLTAFSYVSSHDLQEPLRKIQTFVCRLLDGEKENLSEKGKDQLQRTFQTARRMQQLIEDLLIYSGTKNQQRVFEKTNLNTLFEEVRQNFSEEIIHKQAVVHITGNQEASIIRFQFRQLLQNLISNSLKFSRPGIAPEITIETGIVPGMEIKDTKLNTGIDYCHITYTDNGIGFSPEYNERVFQVFQRLHSRTEYNGTGMGLAICRRVMENHNGAIQAAGESGKGVRFDIYIPITEAPDKAKAARGKG